MYTILWRENDIRAWDRKETREDVVSLLEELKKNLNVSESDIWIFTPEADERAMDYAQFIGTLKPNGAISEMDPLFSSACDRKDLSYKGIIFDEFTQNEDGTYWAEMCRQCLGKFHHLLQDEIDDDSCAIGRCSVKGCNNNGMDPDADHVYIDFQSDLVTLIDVN